MSGEMKILQTISLPELTNWSVRYLLGFSFNYNEDFDLMPIGQFLTRNRNLVNIQDDETYQRVTVRAKNKGVCLRDTEIGKKIGTKKQYTVSSGQFIISKIDARNGAMGLIPDDLDGAIVTNDFPTFVVDNNRINPQFLLLLTTTKTFINFAQSCSSGTTNRQRINIEQFLNIKIPLPSLEEQNKIVANYNTKIKLAKQQETRAKRLELDIENYLFEVLGIEKLEKKGRRKVFRTISFKEVDRWAVDSLGRKVIIESKFQGKFPLIKLRELIISFQYGLSEKSSKEVIGPPMLRMNSIDNSELLLDDLKYINIDDKIFLKFKLNKGDLLFNRTNSKELVGKTAIFDSEENYTFASYLIRVVINEEKANKNYINYLFNSSILKYQKDLVSRQITGQANINSQEMRDFVFPLPPLEIQNITANHISNLKQQIKDLKNQAEQNQAKAIKEFEQEIFITD